MKIKLTGIGKTKEAYLKTGIAEYHKRIQRYNSFEFTQLPDIKNASKLSKEELKKKEGIELLKQLGSGDRLILWDEKGKLYDSVQFASFLEKQLMGSWKGLHFFIGGAYGFSAEVYERANFKIALSPMTFSHQLVRLIITEQLYRAFSILNNEPYHHI